MDDKQNIQGANETDSLNEITEKEYRKLKARLQEIEKKRKGKSLYLMGFLIGIPVVFLCLLLLCDTLNYELNFTSIILSIFFGTLAGCMFGIYANLLFEMRESSIRRKMFEYEAEHIKEDIKEDIFENSIKMSYKYLDQYYLQTREQAQRGFFVTVCVAIFGAILIGTGIIAMFLNRIEPSYITCASGVITEFIAAIFFYLYNKTVSSMSKYHNKLVLSQNISIALKVADSLPTEDKVKTKNLIITELLKDINTYLVKNDISNNQ